MNLARFEAFALAYVGAIRQAAKSSGVHLQPGESLEEYALQTTTDMLDMIDAKGVKSVENYYLNTYGGAFQSVAAELGIAATVPAIQAYLDGH